MIPPPNPASGPAASVAALERLRQFAISSNVTSGGGLRKAFGGGSVFSIPETKRQRPSFGGATPTHPFKLSDATVGTTLKVRVKFGMVNSLTPTGMGGTDPDLLLTVTATKYVVLDVETDIDGLAITATITLETTVPDATSTHGYIALGLVTYTAAGGAVPAYITCNQSVAGSLWHQQCGATTHLFGSV